MQMPMARGQSGATQTLAATGVMSKVDPVKHMINVSHGFMSAINWPTMTMDFRVAPDVDQPSRLVSGSTSR